MNLPYQGEQANINIIVAWAESALVQVNPLFRLLSSHFVCLQVARMINVSSHAEIKEGIAELQAAQVEISCKYSCQLFLANISCKYSCQLFLVKYFLPNILARYFCNLLEFLLTLHLTFLSQVSLYQKQVSLEGLSAQVIIIIFFDPP